MTKRIVASRGAWVAQSAERLASAQIMISQSVSSSPASGFLLTAQSLEPALDSVCMSLSQKETNIKKEKKKNKKPPEMTKPSSATK